MSWYFKGVQNHYSFNYFLSDKLKVAMYEAPGLGLSQLNDGTDRRRFPLQDDNHPGTDPHLVPVFPRLCSGMFLERPKCVRICGFKRNASDLDRAPKMGDSVLMNSWDGFF